MEELTIHEFLLGLEEWKGFALYEVLTNFHLHTRVWSKNERYSQVRNQYRDRLRQLLNDTYCADELIVGKRRRDISTGEVEMLWDDVIFDPKKFILWAQEQKLKLPYEFHRFVNDLYVIPEPDLKERQECKVAVQAVARTLWHLNPKMTATEMLEHPMIDAHGSPYKLDSTVPKWIREVDPRRKQV